MSVNLAGLPPNTDFDLFVLQKATAPFGVAWYQGDVESWGDGNSDTHHFIGRFSIETFAVAPGIVLVPVVFSDPPFPELSQPEPCLQSHPDVPPGAVVQLAGNTHSRPGSCSTVTPFNGEHNAVWPYLRWTLDRCARSTTK